jgi:hypothetical protein
MQIPTDPVVVTLSRAEAIVLFEWLWNFDSDRTLLPEQDSAEQSALWRLEGKIESQLVELFAPHWKELLEEARKKVLNHDIASDNDASDKDGDRK